MLPRATAPGIRKEEHPDCKNVTPAISIFKVFFTDLRASLDEMENDSSTVMSLHALGSVA